MFLLYFHHIFLALKKTKRILQQLFCFFSNQNYQASSLSINPTIFDCEKDVKEPILSRLHQYYPTYSQIGILLFLILPLHLGQAQQEKQLRVHRVLLHRELLVVRSLLLSALQPPAPQLENLLLRFRQCIYLQPLHLNH